MNRTYAIMCRLTREATCYGLASSFFGFSGRINRAKYWLLLILWVVFWAIAAIVLIGAVLAILGLNVTDGKLPGPEHAGKFVRMILDYVVLFIVVVGIAIASWVSGFAIGVKRLHDRNKSGWWILVFYVAPSVLGSVAEKGADDTSGADHGTYRARSLDLGPGGAWFSARHRRTKPVRPRSATAPDRGWRCAGGTKTGSVILSRLNRAGHPWRLLGGPSRAAVGVRLGECTSMLYVAREHARPQPLGQRQPT